MTVRDPSVDSLARMRARVLREHNADILLARASAFREAAEYMRTNTKETGEGSQHRMVLMAYAQTFDEQAAALEKEARGE